MSDAATGVVNGLLERHAERQLRREQRAHIAAGRLTLGTGSYGLFRLTVQRGDQDVRVEIGSYCSIGQQVLFLPGGNHRPDWVSTYPLRARLGMAGAFHDGHPATRGPIVVGHDVWIGRGAWILSGVTIGSGAVVGAAAVVAKDVAPYEVVAGNPARPIRRRFLDHEVEALLAIAWWNWPKERVAAECPALNGGSVEEFIAHNR